MLEGASLTVRQPALSKASLRVSRRLPTSSAYRCSVSTHSPDCRVEWTSKLSPPRVGEVSQALCVDQPARASLLVHSTLQSGLWVDTDRKSTRLDSSH